MGCLPTSAPAHLLSQMDQHKEVPWCDSFVLSSAIMERNDMGSSMSGLCKTSHPPSHQSQPWPSLLSASIPVFKSVQPPLLPDDL